MRSFDMLSVLKSFAGKKVFITGHTGFKGTWLAFLLKELGADVMGYALSPATQPSHFNLLGLDKKITHLVGDIRNSFDLHKALQSFEPEYVFHLAAQALVKKSYADPASTFETNVMGSLNLLDAVKSCDSVHSLVYITSDKCYENLEWVWGYRETDRLGGYDPYSASKAAAEHVFSAYYRSFLKTKKEFGAATARAGNVIGGGDWSEDRIVPDCVRAVKEKRPVILRNPHSTRPWQHVLEPISGYLVLAHALRNKPEETSGAWNFGPSTDEVRTVFQVAHSIVENLGQGSIKTNEPDRFQHEANLLQLNCDKAHMLLNWKPRWTVDKTLLQTAHWYKTWLNYGDIETITKNQIYDYFSELT